MTPLYSMLGLATTNSFHHTVALFIYPYNSYHYKCITTPFHLYKRMLESIFPYTLVEAETQ
ncbi:hypothetical protein HNQ59_003382 [Chitinivorax tropicus]|uniref:Uncharacterized protein n=1 Tax=Chitinivorax tropicus TaxID=714531 RepID=A0A840MSK9_9PROT|nr:hypothetical protein [Chitinivorax tropicus]